MSLPAWVPDAVFYQIFPDRFANGDPSNDPTNALPWDATPTTWGFHGGDLRGIIQRFDYLQDLGINAIYLNPIFQATSNHRYNTTDYYRIDPKLGDMRDFRALVELAHRNGVHLLLDGVFNHCGRGFFAFNDLLENGAHSPYRDWFHVRRFPLQAYEGAKAENYLAWWNMPGLPKFNTANPQVREFLLGVARFWIEQGADGWRLDVPNEIDDDSFWHEFRHTVRQANPDAYLVGEIWSADPRWVGEGHFDGLMNYPLRDHLLAFLAKREIKPTEFGRRVDSLLKTYPEAHAFTQLNTLGSHDTERILTLCGGDQAKVRLAYSFLFCFPGAPAIYYGDEVGMQGGKDPDCRRAFPWSQDAWDLRLRGHVQKLTAIRTRLPELRRGDFQWLALDDDSSVCAFVRSLGPERAMVLLNCSASPRVARVSVGELGWPDGKSLWDAMTCRPTQVAGAEVRLDLQPLDGAILVDRPVL